MQDGINFVSNDGGWLFGKTSLYLDGADDFQEKLFHEKIVKKFFPSCNKICSYGIIVTKGKTGFAKDAHTNHKILTDRRMMYEFA